MQMQMFVVICES